MSDKLHRCFSCKLDVPESEVRKTGRTKKGHPWYLCVTCSDAYAATMSGAPATTVNRIKTGSRGTVKMGWNGVPSDRTLRGRNR